jgi:hypothetical protein
LGQPSPACLRSGKNQQLQQLPTRNYHTFENGSKSKDVIKKEEDIRRMHCDGADDDNGVFLFDDNGH